MWASGNLVADKGPMVGLRDRNFNEHRLSARLTTRDGIDPVVAVRSPCLPGC